MNEQKLKRIKGVIESLNKCVEGYESGTIKEGLFLEGCTRNGLRLLNIFRKIYRRDHNIHAFIVDIKRKLIC